MAFKLRLPQMFRGAAYKKTFVWNSQDSEGVKTPNDLTGFNGRIQLRDEAGQIVHADWSTANGKLIFLNNRISIKISRSETEAYGFDNAKWDLLIWPGALVEEAEVIMYGEIDAPQTITDLP